MEGAEAVLYRGGAGHPSSPIEFSADGVYVRHLGAGAGNLSSSASRTGAPPPRSMQQQQTASPPAAADESDLARGAAAAAAASVGPTMEEGELDQFDIVLQQDAAAAARHPSPSNPGTHSPSGATPPLSAGGYAASTCSGGLAGDQRGSPSGLYPGTAGRLLSVAETLHLSAVIQDRDQCARLIHQMATACRGELHLHPHSGGTSVASPGGDPRATSSSAAQQPQPQSQQQQPTSSAPGGVVVGLDPFAFEEDLTLVTDIISEANMAHNAYRQQPLPYRSLHHAGSHAAGHVSPHGVARASPRNGGVGGGVAAVSAAAAASTLSATASPLGASASAAVHARSHSRGSPASAMAGGTFLGPSALASMATGTVAADGRSTIDTEVCDSLGRLAHVGGGGGQHHHLYPALEHGARPMNPCQGGAPPSGATGKSVRSISQQQLQPHQQAWTPLAHDPVSSPSHLDRAAIASLSSQASRRPSGSAARSTSASVKHPRAVKPEVSSEGGPRRRGPRSRTGKNVAPSNHSAFSECSGGETRSCRSTVTGANRLLSSSVNATTNTSLTSSVFNQIQVNHGMTVNAVGSRSTVA